jgi:hypothetical protein
MVPQWGWLEHCAQSVGDSVLASMSFPHTRYGLVGVVTTPCTYHHASLQPRLYQQQHHNTTLAHSLTNSFKPSHPPHKRTTVPRIIRPVGVYDLAHDPNMIKRTGYGHSNGLHPGVNLHCYSDLTLCRPLPNHTV